MRRLVLAAILAATVAAPASAHHSAAMFDRTRSVDLKGTVKEFQWTNPHSWIQVEAPGPDGKMEEWAVECGSPNTLARNGWRPGSFKPGDKVTVRIGPMKDGSKAGIFVGAVLADGRILGQMGS
jgi:Ni/Co efflux regulator RcnB